MLCFAYLQYTRTMHIYKILFKCADYRKRSDDLIIKVDNLEWKVHLINWTVNEDFSVFTTQLRAILWFFFFSFFLFHENKANHIKHHSQIWHDINAQSADTKTIHCTRIYGLSSSQSAFVLFFHSPAIHCKLKTINEILIELYTQFIRVF